MSCVLYHICQPSEEGDLSKGYIGISSQPESRWDKHFSGHGNKLVNKALDKYEELSHSVVFAGPRSFMLTLERLLRPVPMAWNLVEGGGDPPNLSGKKWTEEQARAIPLANSGKNSPYWKGYWVVDGVKYESMNQAAKALGCAKRTVRNRALSEDFPNWQFEEQDVSNVRV
jgi:predicted GIY-YIG superfamily endonuclease